VKFCESFIYTMINNTKHYCVRLMQTVNATEICDKAESHVAVILPTYCEAENIEHLILTIENLNIDSTIQTKREILSGNFKRTIRT
jgi:hypothetical protein